MLYLEKLQTQIKVLSRGQSLKAQIYKTNNSREKVPKPSFFLLKISDTDDAKNQIPKHFNLPALSLIFKPVSPVIVVEPFSLFRCVDTLLTSVKVACDVTWNTTNSILTKKTQLNPNYQYSAVFIFIITKETVQISIIIINTTIMDRISLLLHRLRASCKKQDKHHHDCRTLTQIQRRKKPNVFQKEFSIKQTYLKTGKTK